MHINIYIHIYISCYTCVCVCVWLQRAAKGGNNFGRNKISSGRCCKAQQETDEKKNTNLGNILLKRRVVERVAQWQLQWQLKGQRKRGRSWDWEWDCGRSLASSWNLSRRRDSRDARLFMAYIWFSNFVSRASFLCALSLTLSHSPLSRGIDILTAVLGELQQQKSLHKYLFIYATKSTLATRSAHKQPPWGRSGGRVQCVSNRLCLSSRCPHCDESVKCSTAND